MIWKFSQEDKNISLRRRWNIEITEQGLQMVLHSKLTVVLDFYVLHALNDSRGACVIARESSMSVISISYECSFWSWLSNQLPACSLGERLSMAQGLGLLCLNGKLEEAPGSELQTGSVTALGTIWGVNKEVEDLSVLPLFKK